MSVLAAVNPVVDIAPAQQFIDFAMSHDRFTDSRGPAHRLLHQLRRLHAAAVVREADDLRGQGREIDQFAASALAHRDRTVGFHAHHGVAADDLQLLAERRRRIGRRVQVGHRADRGIPPAGRGGRTRRNGLLRGKPGSRRCTCTSTSPGTRCRPPRSTTRSPGRGSPAAAMRPPSTAISPGSKRPLRKIFALV